MNSIDRIAFEHLTRLGWRVDRLLPNIATRDIDTAAGGRTASINGNRSSDGQTLSLSATYWSEGRNALSTCVAEIPTHSGDEDLRAAVERFAAEVQAAIDETYAVRLLRRAGHAPG